MVARPAVWLGADADTRDAGDARLAVHAAHARLLVLHPREVARLLLLVGVARERQGGHWLAIGGSAGRVAVLPDLRARAVIAPAKLAAAVVPAVSTAAAALCLEAQPLRDDLHRLLEERDEVARDGAVGGRVERGGHALPAHAARAANAVDVRVDVARQLVVDHVEAVGHVEAARRHVRRHQHRRLAAAKRVQRVLALALRAVAVDRRRRHT
mmetsp:Transcript_17327/g.37215  ORF Transcript_17327/g.37215 Transcript_17327/m.37215 type:complete len:212 (-) Transcript_17327:326-961(-)